MIRAFLSKKYFRRKILRTDYAWLITEIGPAKSDTRRQISVSKRVLISQALISFGERHTERRFAERLSLSRRTAFRFLRRMTKWQRVGRLGPAILPFPFRNYANCRLSFLSSAAYCGRKRFVIDYARRTFGLPDSRKSRLMENLIRKGVRKRDCDIC